MRHDAILAALEDAPFEQVDLDVGAFQARIGMVLLAGDAATDVVNPETVEDVTSRLRMSNHFFEKTGLPEWRRTLGAALGELQSNANCHLGDPDCHFRVCGNVAMWQCGNVLQTVPGHFRIRFPSLSIQENGRMTSTGFVEIFSPRMFSNTVP